MERKSQKLALAIRPTDVVGAARLTSIAAQRIFVGLEAGLDTTWPPRFNGQDVNHRPSLEATFEPQNMPRVGCDLPCRDGALENSPNSTPRNL